MEAFLVLAIALACPLMMLLMMRGMGHGHSRHGHSGAPASTDELRRLRDELDRQLASRERTEAQR